ncbi:MAG: hypothetical protein K0Q84_237, partial [Arthrobacter sp.]|nr:hypothetical protein [Arthrobacter sp.]
TKCPRSAARPASTATPDQGERIAQQGISGAFTHRQHAGDLSGHRHPPGRALLHRTSPRPQGLSNGRVPGGELNLQRGHLGLHPGQPGQPIQIRIRLIPQRIPKISTTERVSTRPGINTGLGISTRRYHMTVAGPVVVAADKTSGAERNSQRSNGGPQDLQPLRNCPVIHTHSMPVGCDIKALL